MAEEAHRSRLGRGLAALIADSSAQMPHAPESRDRRRLRMSDIRPNPRNPRRRFAEEDLAELAQSIREKGLIQPIVVRAVAGGSTFEIIAGERRWRAAGLAGLEDVPVVLVEASDKEALELAIIENVQRADLNAIEEARGYEQLAQDYGYSQADLARVIGKSRSHVANTLRLLRLPASVETMVVEGSLSAGHARALLGFDDPEPIARRIVEQGLTVRDVERLAQAQQRPRPSPSRVDAPPAAPPSAESRTLAARLSTLLGLSVEVEIQGQGGEIRIRYRSRDEFESLCRQFAPG